MAGKKRTKHSPKHKGLRVKGFESEMKRAKAAKKGKRHPRKRTSHK